MAPTPLLQRPWFAGLALFVVFMGVASALWAWRGRRIDTERAAFLPPATFSVAWVLVYGCLAAAVVLCRREPLCRALLIAAVALTWAWVVVRAGSGPSGGDPGAAAAGFLVIVAALAALLAAWGLASRPAARAALALPVAWLVAALVLSGAA
jgi:hypothetical protein